MLVHFPHAGTFFDPCALKYICRLPGTVQKFSQHGHIQTFAESSRSRDQRDLITGIQKFFDKLCFIHITGLFLSKSAKILHTDE